MALLLVTFVLAPYASAAAPQVDTFAGGPGEGPALDVAQAPRTLAFRAGVVYVADIDWHVVRALDLATGTETVVAGNGTAGFSGDGGPGNRAQLSSPNGVAVDADGNVFVADTFNHRVRRIDVATGAISTVVGTGSAGFDGDGGAPTSARLSSPRDVTVGPDGALYVADTSNHRIRKVSGGTISTVAGNGAAGFSGDGGPATSASLRSPFGVDVDGDGTMLIADTSNNRVRAVSPGGTISTIAGSGVSGFSGDGGPATSAALSFPSEVSASALGVLIADRSNNRIRVVDADGIISTAAGSGAGGFSGDGGAPTDAALSGPQGVVAGAGGFFVADTGNRRVREVSGGAIQTVAGNGLCCFGGDGGLARSAQAHVPQGLAADDAGNVFFSDAGTHRVRRVGEDGVVLTVAGTGVPGASGDGGPASEATLNQPYGLAAHGGNLYVADAGNNRVRVIGADGIISNFAGTGGFGFSGDGAAATGAQLRRPSGVAVDADGSVFIADTQNNRIRKVDASGIISTVAGNGVAGFSGDGGPATSAALRSPTSVALDGEGNLYIADTFNHRVRKVDAAGVISTLAGNGLSGFSGDDGPAADARLASPQGVAVDASGNVYIADTNNRRVRRVDGSGVIATVVGSGLCCYGGDGGPATDARMTNPLAVAFDDDGALHFTDVLNRRVRFVPIDTVPPETTASLSGPEGLEGWWRGAVTVTLSATDDVSGVAQTHVRVDGGDWSPYSVPIEVSGDGTHAVEYFSVDKVGNSEEARSVEIRIDATPPAISIAPPAERYLLGDVFTPTWEASDATSGLSHATGTFAGEPAESGAGIVLSTPGTHTLEVSATDVAGNGASSAVEVEVLIPAQADFDPHMLNTRANGSSSKIAVRVELPAGYDATAIPCPIVVRGPGGEAASLCEPAPATDRDGDGLLEQTFRFVRDDLRAIAPPPPAEWRAEIAGTTADGYGWIAWSTLIVR